MCWLPADNGCSPYRQKSTDSWDLVMATVVSLPASGRGGGGCRGIRGSGQLTAGAGSMCSFCFEFTLSEDAKVWVM